MVVGVVCPRRPHSLAWKGGENQLSRDFLCVQLSRKLLDPRQLSHWKTLSRKVDPAKKEGILVFLQDTLTCQENTCMKINFNFLHFTSLLTPLFLRIYFLRNISTTEQSLRISHGKVPVTNDTKGHIKL